MKNHYGVILLQKGYLESNWYIVNLLTPTRRTVNGHSIQTGMKWSFHSDRNGMTSTPFRPEWNGPFHSGRNGMVNPLHRRKKYAGGSACAQAPRREISQRRLLTAFLATRLLKIPALVYTPPVLPCFAL